MHFAGVNSKLLSPENIVKVNSMFWQNKRFSLRIAKIVSFRILPNCFQWKLKYNSMAFMESAFARILRLMPL